MKKYFIVLLFIISCNGLSKSISSNMGQTKSTQKLVEDIGENKTKQISTIELDTVNLEVASYEYLKAWYCSIADLASDRKKAYQDIKSFLREGRLLFFDLSGKLTLTKEALIGVVKTWNEGRTLFSDCDDIDDIFNTKNFIKIPDRIRFPMALDDLKESHPESFKENNSTYHDQVDCFKGLLIAHADNDKIKERFYNLYSQAYQGNFDSLLAVVVGLNNQFILERFLSFITLKNIKISINDTHIGLYNQENLPTVGEYGDLDEESEPYNEYSLFEYLLAFGQKGSLKLLASYNWKVNKNPEFSIKYNLLNKLPAEKFKELVEIDRYLGQSVIISLLYHGKVAKVLDYIHKGLIKKATLVKSVENDRCELEITNVFSVFNCTIQMYMKSIYDLPIKTPEIKEELKMLKELLKILIAERPDLLPNERCKRNIVVDIMYCPSQEFCPERFDYKEVHDLIVLLSEHPDFKNIIDEFCPPCSFDTISGRLANKTLAWLYYRCHPDSFDHHPPYTISRWLNRYGLPKTKVLLASIKSSH